MVTFLLLNLFVVTLHAGLLSKSFFKQALEAKEYKTAAAVYETIDSDDKNSKAVKTLYEKNQTELEKHKPVGGFKFKKTSIPDKLLETAELAQQVKKLYENNKEDGVPAAYNTLKGVFK